MKSSDTDFSVEFDEDTAYYNEMILLKEGKKFKSRVKGLTVKSRVYSLSPTNLCIKRRASIEIDYRGSDHKKNWDLQAVKAGKVLFPGR